MDKAKQIAETRLPGGKVVELELDEVKKVREQLPLLKHRRGDIYALTTFSL